MGNLFHGIITGLYKRAAQKQILRRVATNSQFRRDDQPRSSGISGGRSINDFLCVARHVANAIIQL
jgi:hypothetical protein